ncbi:hypothetical protein E1B28_002182 [Marasmius oreades]|uniref:Uncharacterized protein n=1 Tax=Marasmius oreades TaxID=181124 RepID=A0A9P7RM27_9AGAR|nr:uncharacterized protein E1B28_002182 [Marasmius oreades]KAG7086216.1 hypothetical protein E1B28_002182 [Marasmius oreades]
MQPPTTTTQGHLEKPRTKKRVKFTPEEDVLLLDFVEQMKSKGCLPQSKVIYLELVQNKDGKWPWGQGRTAKGWSRRYQRLLRVKEAPTQAASTKLIYTTQMCKTKNHHATRRNKSQSDSNWKDGSMCQEKDIGSCSYMLGISPDNDLEEEREVEESLICHPRWRHKHKATLQEFFSRQGIGSGDDNEEAEEVTKLLCPLS